MNAPSKPPVFLLDAMSFIFRAYHAMQRSRPMSTRSGLPTAATYVFVNMIKKLRQDFAPRYFAAVFDLSGEVFRDERARAIGTLRKWNSKSQSFEDVSYEGYKAKRESMPEDLRRQIPYIRRSLEALHIPILEAEGFEADDVIGTLAREAAEQGHEVFIVSGDKDMMQLVTERVKILNPQKDNLILDPAKVTEVLGVPPEKVVDVMALRGDTVDNIPGAPGIGDKGSVDSSSNSAASKRCSTAPPRSSARAIANRSSRIAMRCCCRRNWSQSTAMFRCRSICTRWKHRSRTSRPAARCSLNSNSPRCCANLRLPPRPCVELIDEPTPEQICRLLRSRARAWFRLCARCRRAARRRNRRRTRTSPVSARCRRDAESKTLSSIGVCAESAHALCLPLTSELRALFEDATVPKRVHDWKLALHVLSGLGVELRGAVDDTMLLSYALNPTHATQSLADVAARHNQLLRIRYPPPQLPSTHSHLSCATKSKREASRASTPRSTCLLRPCSFAWSRPASASTQLH